jgi:hypothetical protein
MRELNLDALLKEKREEPTSVSITTVKSWIKGGIVFVGLFATIKWLFTKKMWFMLTSISSISIATIIAIVQFNATSPTLIKVANHQHHESKKVTTVAEKEKTVSILKQFNAAVDNDFMTGIAEMALLSPTELFTEYESNSVEPTHYNTIAPLSSIEPKDHFTRIDANGFVHFTLVKGSSCSVQNTIPADDEGSHLTYSIKNGTLYLNSANDNNATDLIITVVDLEKIKLNGFCELVTNSTFESTDLEIDANGFTNFTVDLNVKDLEVDINGETKGKLNLKGKNLDFESTGFSDVEIECDFEQSRIEVTGFSKIKLIGSCSTTIMEVTGESKLIAEEFASQDLFLKVSGENDKIETSVSSKLDVEISGDNTVIINGLPEIVHQQVTKDSKLKIK